MKEITELIRGIFIEKGEDKKSEQIIINLFEFSEEYQISEFIKFEEMAIKLFAKNSNQKNLRFHYEHKSEGIFEQCITTIAIFKKGFYLNRPKKPTQQKDGYVYTLIILSLQENQNEREGLTILNFNNKEDLIKFLEQDSDIKCVEINDFIKNLKVNK